MTTLLSREIATGDLNSVLEIPIPAYAVGTGLLTQAVASPGAYVALADVGTGGVVTRPLFLFVEADTAVLLQLTMVDPGGGADIVSVLPLDASAPVALRFPANGYPKAVKVKGTAGVEYLAVGSV